MSSRTTDRMRVSAPGARPTNVCVEKKKRRAVWAPARRPRRARAVETWAESHEGHRLGNVCIRVYFDFKYTVRALSDENGPVALLSRSARRAHGALPLAPNQEPTPAH